MGKEQYRSGVGRLGIGGELGSYGSDASVLVAIYSACFNTMILVEGVVAVSLASLPNPLT